MNSLKTNRLVLGGIVILTLLCGFGSCLGLYSWWLPQSPESPGLSTPDGAFATATSDPTNNIAAVLPDGTACGTVPAGWSQYVVQSGDTISDLAMSRGITVEAVTQANCLASVDTITAGQPLYLPVLPTATPCPIVRPTGWEMYTVRQNDTISTLGAAHGTTVEEIMRVNCLSSDTIFIGQDLFLPALPTPTPTRRPTATPTEPPIIPTTVAPPTAAVPTVVPASVATTAAGPPTPAPTVSVSTSVPATVGPTAVGQVAAESSTVEPSNFTPTPIPVDLVAGGDPGGEVPGVEFFEYEPCEGDTSGEPSLVTLRSTVELGQRTYYFACNFTNPISATVTRNDGITESVEIHGSMSTALPPYIAAKITDTVTAAIEWSALPTLPVTDLEVYILTVYDNTSDGPTPYQVEIFIEPPTEPHILIVPQAGPLFEADFVVYFVNFTPSSTVTYNQFSQGQASKGEETEKLYYRKSKQVLINQTMPIYGGETGWAVKPLDLGPAPTRLTYGISWDNKLADKQPDWLFWLY